jgi:hypothetical protein
MYELIQPLWTDPAEQTFFATRMKRLETSKDLGRTWVR